MLIAILGRQPELSLAELEAVHGSDRVALVAPECATVDGDNFDLSHLGGTTKYGRVIFRIPAPGHGTKSALVTASRRIIQHYHEAWRDVQHKITLGISAYNFSVSSRDVQKTGLLLKSALKKHGVSLRLVPNDDTALSTAVSHNNKLGLSANKVELMIIKTQRDIIVAESCGAQNITAYARRDRDRPKRDAFVGMLPPKLTQIMLNLALTSSPPNHPSSQTSSSTLPTHSSRSTLFSSSATGTRIERSAEISLESISQSPQRSVGSGGEPTTSLSESPQSSSRATKSSETSAARVTAAAYATGTRREAVSEDFGGEDANKNKSITILDPFCGTGTVLQEALLRGFSVYGSDLNPKMVDYTLVNLDWLQKGHRSTGTVHTVTEADATTHTWPEATKLSAVVCETYLGQPFSAPPSPEKLREVVGNCNHIITEFLKNIRSQLSPDTPLCIAVPAWRDKDGRLEHLPLVRDPSKFGYTLTRQPLIYARPDQVVAREILVLKKI